MATGHVLTIFPYKNGGINQVVMHETIAHTLYAS